MILSLDERLQVKDNATEKQLRNAFIRASLKHHPDDFDETESKSEALRLFQEIGDAYHTLSDEGRLRGYNKAGRQMQYFLVEKTKDLKEIQRAYNQQFLDAVKYELEHLDPKNIQQRDDVQLETQPDAVTEPTAVENDNTAQNTDLRFPVAVNDGVGEPSPRNARSEGILVDNSSRNSLAGTIKPKKKYVPGPWTIAGFMSGTVLGVVLGGPFIVVGAGVGYWGGRRRDVTGKSIYDSVYEEYENLTWEDKKAFLKRLTKFFVDVVLA
jgi:hypothetical protein